MSSSNEIANAAEREAADLSGVLKTLSVEWGETRAVLDKADNAGELSGEELSAFCESLRAQLQARDEAVYPELEIHDGLTEIVKRLKQRSGQILQSLDLLEAPSPAGQAWSERFDSFLKSVEEYADLEQGKLLPWAAERCNDGELEGLDAKYQAKKSLITDSIRTGGSNEYQAEPKTREV